MTCKLENVAFDAADPYALAQFWSQVTGLPVHPDDKPGDPEVTIEMPGGPTLFFQQVPEPKTVKNRVHVCLRPEQTRDGEVERLLGLGATFLHDHREPDGLGWVILGDPEGNEFCVLRGTAERAGS
jgi:predicted enzyme related to lactoylglutathione lyase